MSQDRRRRPRRQSPPPKKATTSVSPAVYIAIVSVVVFSLLIAGLSTVDWSGLFPSDLEPTPDYNVDAIATQEAIVAQNPDDVAAKSTLASMLANSGRIDEAIDVYEEAIQLEPDNASVRLDFARALQTNNMPTDAEAQFLRVLEIEPDNHTAHYYLGRLYLSWQPRRQDEAVYHLEKVVDIAPNSYYAEQATAVLDTIGPATPPTYEVTPISSPTF